MTGNGQLQGLTNHIGLVLDSSSSMHPHARSLVEATDAQVAYLAKRSQEMGQETRISVWTFSFHNQIRCLVWDTDVLRLPSIGRLYRPDGMTALVDATLTAISDLRETPERHGDHSFLVYVMTDGQENNSRRTPPELRGVLDGLPDNWTVAALVPDERGMRRAWEYGFPNGNVERWDTSSSEGVAEAVSRIQQTTDAYMSGRASGVRSTRTLFSTGADAVNAATVAAAGLTPLRPGAFHLVQVHHRAPIREFVEQVLGEPFVIGRGFYQLVKTETIQPQKDLVVAEKNGGRRYFAGRQARSLVGLPDMTVKVKPDYNPDYEIFVQSTSVNRVLTPGTRFLYLK